MNFCFFFLRRKWQVLANFSMSYLMDLPKHRAEARAVGPLLVPPTSEVCEAFSKFFKSTELMPAYERLLRRHPPLLILSGVRISWHSLDSVVFFTMHELRSAGCEAILRRCILRSYMARISRYGIIIDKFNSKMVLTSFEKYCSRNRANST